jgi:hypothetical protein
MPLFDDCKHALNQDLKAKQIEDQFPDCCCEQFSVGVGSPGRIEDHEVLYRMFTDPVDVDQYGRLAREAFSSVYKNGLSIIRAGASDNDVRTIVSDILSVKQGRPFKKILAVFRIACTSFRHFRMMHQGNLVKGFCVYDQTVPRVLNQAAPPVPTHGAVLSRCLFALPTTRRQFENDCNDALHRLITINPVAVDSFRNGLIAQLNDASLQGHFVRP